MAVFVGTFNNWAEEQEYRIDQDDKNLTNDINDLKEKTSRERIALIGLSAGAAIVTVGTAVLASIVAPFAPAIIVNLIATTYDVISRNILHYWSHRCRRNNDCRRDGFGL